MNRRDLLKRTGTLVVGLPALRASSLTNSIVQSDGKYLVVNFNGPFCFWMNPDGTKGIKVMAPPVGTNYDCAKHQGWVGSSGNEKQIPSSSSGLPPEDFELLVTPGVTELPHSGTPVFQYEQGPTGANPLFNLFLPPPAQIIGVRPTCVEIICHDGSDKCNTYRQRGGGPETFASGLTLLYQNVDLPQVKIVHKKTKENFFVPCFENDMKLPSASLNIHLTMLDQTPDMEHRHATSVWSQMMTMYPEMLEEIKGIKFYGLPKECKCSEISTGKKNSGGSDSPNKTLIGPGNDCEVPIMMLQEGGGNPAKRK